MKIAEIYKSIQGEGFLTGQESVFVRLSGCNLRCWYCDTAYASWLPEGRDQSVEEVLEQVLQMDASHVVLTGGEPMLFAELIPLCDTLRRNKKHITIETAGTLYLPLECDLMSISPKLANSTPTELQAPRWRERHDNTRHAPDVIRKMVADYPYQIKFVIDSPLDCAEVEGYLREFPEILRERTMLMPQGMDERQTERTAEWLEPHCRENGFVYCPRKQLEWFGMIRGT